VRRLKFVVFLGFLFLLVMSVPAFGEELKDSSTVMLAQATSREDMKSELDALKKKMDDMRSLEQRIKTLEKKLEEAEKVTTKVKEEEAKLQEDKKTRAIAYYRDGFFLETPDKNFRLQFGGVLHFDTRIFESDRSASSFDIRRARYDMRGYLYKWDIEHMFRLQIEMADQPYLRNAYWMFKFRPEFNIQIGQFKIPSGGADWLTEEAQVNFVEYATGTPVSPFFDRGINIHSFFLGGKIQTNLAAFTGAGIDTDVTQGDWDSNKDYVVRLLLVPFKGSKNKYVKGLHFAGSYQDGLQSIKTIRGEASSRTENYESRWYRWKQPFVDLNERKRYGGEFHWLVGPATLSYEFNRVEWENLTVYRYNGNSPNFSPSYKADQIKATYSYPGRYHDDVHQVWVSYFLTGEEKQFEDVFFAWRQPKPKKNFSLKDGTWGAWEVMARYAYHNTSSGLFTPHTVAGEDVTILEGSTKGYSLTGGLRWIWNPKVRIMLDANYLKSTEGQGIQVAQTAGGTFDTNASGARAFKKSETALLMRLILTP